MESALLQEYHSDPEFRIFKLPGWRAKLYTFLSINLWGRLPGKTQRKLSACYARCYSTPFSRHIIRPYSLLYYRDTDYLKKFKPPGEKEAFECFQDFFIREFRKMPTNPHTMVWPCEGLLCEQQRVNQVKLANVKGDKRTVATIFGLEEGVIPGDYSFSNIFLHNKNYHRIHAPVEGTISRIQHIPGDLVVLRPWIYEENPSLPAFRNERYNVDISDGNGQTWHLSIVGGPAVGTIEIPEKVYPGARVGKLQELAVFYLGSTCCIAAPVAPRYHKRNHFVEVGATY